MSHLVGRAALQLVTHDVTHEHEPRRSSGRVAGATSQRTRIVDGALACLGRQGAGKTTIDDVARAAGCSRATVYRVFPGGKDAVMAAVVDTELSRLFSELAVRMGEAEGLEDVLVAGMTCASERIAGHGALRFLLEHEPELVLPHLAFDHHDDVLAAASGFAAPFLGRWLDHREAIRIAEWAARIVLSYLSCPAPGVDLTDAECTRRIVRTYVLPGISVLSADTDVPGGTPGSTSRRLVPVSGNTATKGENP